MDTAGFHKVRLAVQQNAPQAGAQPTEILQSDLEQALAGSGLFERVELGRTDDPNQMVIGLCRCASEILPWEAGLGVERLWRAVTGAFQWESHTVDCTHSMMEFEGAVTVDERGHYLTVHLVAEAFAPAAQDVAQDAPAPVALVTDL